MMSKYQLIFTKMESAVFRLSGFLKIRYFIIKFSLIMQIFVIQGKYIKSPRIQFNKGIGCL